MECNFSIKRFIEICVFLFAIGALAWQSQNTFETFIAGRTTFAISKQTSDSMLIPTIVVCQTHEWNNGQILKKDDAVNISDKDWFHTQFYWLNDKMNMSFFAYADDLNLTVGNNTFSFMMVLDYDTMKSTTFNSSLMVEQFLNPWIGLCYAIIPGPSLDFVKDDVATLKVKFSDEIESPSISVYLVSEEDCHGFMLADFGRLTPFKVPLSKLGKTTWSAIEKRIWNPLQCKNYLEGEDSHMKCQLKNFIKCFKKMGPYMNCTCVPKNTIWSFLELYPIDNWDECQTNTEYSNCLWTMDACSYNLTSNCPPACKKVEYTGQMIDFPGIQYPYENGMALQIAFKSMDTETHTEVLQYDLANFIGNVGGSFGLFIGFSLTGFVGQVLDYFIRD